MPTKLDARIWDRVPDDWYVEPKRVTEQLLTAERFEGRTWDPACGRGHIVETLLAHGLDACGTDLRKRTDAGWFRGTIDFLRQPWRVRSQNIVTNPPFYGGEGAERFIRLALDAVPGKVAVFVEARFLGGHGRAVDLFGKYPPSRIWMVLPRPSCPPGAYIEAGGKAESGRQDYLWLVWDADRAGERKMGWLTSHGPV